MKGFIGKFFAGGDEEEEDLESVIECIGQVLDGIIEKADLELSFDIIEVGPDELSVEFCGEDDFLLTNKSGQLLDAFQLYVKRVSQHRFPNLRLNLNVDCNDHRKKSKQVLVDLAEKLKQKSLDKDGPVYVRALPPQERKIIHQYIAEDDSVKSLSVGNGFYKKIKIFPQQSSSDL